MMPTSNLVIGVDAGGTSTRAALATTNGTFRGHGRAGAGNPLAHGTHRAAAAIGVAVRSALGAHDANAVSRVVVGLAGDGALTDPATAAAFTAQWAAIGLQCPVEIVGDAVAAFASAACEAEGSVLIAGTGASAVRIAGRSIRDTAGGLGWLLGDEGAGFWLGRGAVRACVEALSGRVESPILAPQVCRSLGVEDPDPTTVITAAYARPPLELATLAPLVTAAARQGDPAAERLVAAAASELIATLAKIRGPGPTVLAGSCLTTGNPVAESVAAQAAASGEVRFAGAAQAGAAWLAAVGAGGLAAAAAADLHTAMMEQVKKVGIGRTP
jgi:N-acetylglucosamine kinase-like BadF-type ATPase